MRVHCPLAAYLLVAVAACLGAPTRRGENLVGNSGFEAETAEWEAYGAGYEIDSHVAHSGTRSLRCSGATPDAVHGARHVITLDPPVRHPFRISGWARARDAEVGQDFNVYLDLHYADGTPLWGQVAHFKPGTHDWQQTEYVFDVARPVKTIEVFVLFRKARGTVWFDDIRVELVPFAFRSVEFRPGVFGGRSLAVSATTTLPAKWQVDLTTGNTSLQSAAGDALPVRLFWTESGGELGTKPPEATLRIRAEDDLLGEEIEIHRTLDLAANTPPRGYALWTDDSMHRVLPHSLPPEGPLPQPAEIELARNEYESFQVVLLACPGVALGEVRVEPGPLTCPETKHTLPPECLEWQQVGYVRMEKLFAHPAYSEAVAGWWPDPLLPRPSVTVPDGFAQAVWLTLHAPPDTPAGAYVGDVWVRPAARPAAAVAVRATVLPLTLPVRGHMKTAFALMDGFLERVYGRPLSPRIRRQFGDFVLRHRLNPDDISRTSPPAIEDLLHYRDRGLNAFNVLNMVEERGERPWVCWSPLSVYTPEFETRLVERMEATVAELRRNDLADRAYVYTFDERGEEFFPTIRKYFGLIKQNYPELHTLTTAKVPQDPERMRELNVDWNCPLSSAYHFAEAEACRRQGLQVWSYICLGPRYPFANWLADDPLVEARVIWWQAFHQKMDGFLYWGLNIWSRTQNEEPIDPAADPRLGWSITTGRPATRWERLHGDGVLLYPGKDGPLGSIRLANIRDGLEDYEYLWLLSHKAGVEEARQACLPVTGGLTEFTRDAAVLRRQRAAVARRLLGALAK